MRMGGSARRGCLAGLAAAFLLFACETPERSEAPPAPKPEPEAEVVAPAPPPPPPPDMPADGRVLVEETGRLPRNQAQWLHYAGRKRPGQAFPPGRYRGEYRVTREAGGHRVTVVAVSRAIELR